MSFRVELTRQAEKAFDLIMKAQPSIGARIARAIDRISADPDIGVPLKGALKGLNKYRVGPYRVIYEVRRSHLLIVVIDIGHRKEVYR
ncbi:MAG: type II toxin-antitoxin system RelE/ParE family toxin [Pseudomonadota bacterium]